MNNSFSTFYKTLSAHALTTLEQKDIAINQLLELCYYFDTIIENSIDGIFITDGEGNVIIVNRAYEIMSGIRREEIIGMNMLNFESKNFISQSATLIALKERVPITIDQLLIRTQKKALVSCNPLFSDNGEITMVVSSVRDITELESLRERVMKEKERAERFQSTLEILKEQMVSRPSIVAQDETMVNLIFQAQRLAKLDTTILLLGETGVGKDEMAKFIHENSPRAKQHFIKVNCGAIVDSLMESEFFGYEKGAFTGADKSGKIGMFEVADKGTLFLDEIGELPLDMQVKLLRAIQEREITRVGGVKPIALNVRIIAATNKDLRAMVARNEFREDLYYRLNVVPIMIPPLRQRQADIIPMINQFASEFNEKYGLHVSFTTEAMYKLVSHSWPGNIRELRNTIERSMVLCNSRLITPEGISFDNDNENVGSALHSLNDYQRTMELVENRFILQAYQLGGSITKGAQLLNMKRSTFAAKLKRIKDSKKNKGA